MKTENWAVLIGILVGFGIAAGAIVMSPKQQMPQGYTAEDVSVRDRASISKKEDAWRVAMIMTNTDDIAILKVTPAGAGSDSPIAHYATTTDSSITQGVSVRLIEVSCFGSPGDTVAFGGRPATSYVAVRNDREGSFKPVVHADSNNSGF